MESTQGFHFDTYKFNNMFLLNQKCDKFVDNMNQQLNDTPIHLAPITFMASSSQCKNLPPLSAVLETLSIESVSLGPRSFINHTPPLIYTHRKRRKYNEINRKFKCSFPRCFKSYGTLSHLNFHIKSQCHGSLKSAKEFKD